MIKGSPRLTLESILSKITQYDIYRFYLGFDFKFNKKVKSCFRKDDDPSLSFKMETDKTIIYCDFGDMTYKGGVVNFVMQLFNITDYYEVLKKIDYDFNLGLCKHRTINPISTKSIISNFITPDEVITHKKKIQIIDKDFSDQEIEYWQQYYITVEELKSNNVFSIDKLYLNKTLVPSFKQLRFAYLYDEYMKIYYPYAEKPIKWMFNNTPNDFISGLDDIKYKAFNGSSDKKLIVTKSKKDEIVLKKFFKDVCSTQSENHVGISEENIEFFSKVYGPENVYIIFDNDQPGVKACKYYNQFGFKYFNVEKKYLDKKITDASDLVKAYGLDMLEYWLTKKQIL